MDHAAHPIASDGHHEVAPNAAAGLPIPEPVLSQSNPYAPSAVNELSKLEAEVLGEYARMSDNLERLTSITNKLASSQPEIMHAIVPLEKKLGMVLTLFKASVWATYVAQEAREEQAEMEEQQRRQQPPPPPQQQHSYNQSSYR